MTRHFGFILLHKLILILFCNSNLADRLKSPYPSSSSQLPPPESLGSKGAKQAMLQQSESLNYNDSYQQDFRIPQCYHMSKPKDLPESTIKDFPVNVLFFIFYNMPYDRAQLTAANLL